jgi:hypothetical protein
VDEQEVECALNSLSACGDAIRSGRFCGADLQRLYRAEHRRVARTEKKMLNGTAE